MFFVTYKLQSCNKQFERVFPSLFVKWKVNFAYSNNFLYYDYSRTFALIFKKLLWIRPLSRNDYTWFLAKALTHLDDHVCFGGKHEWYSGAHGQFIYETLRTSDVECNGLIEIGSNRGGITRNLRNWFETMRSSKFRISGLFIFRPN